MSQNTITKDEELKPDQIDDKNVNFKSKKNKGKTFFGIIFDYLKRNVWVGILLVLFSVISSLSAILGPKIIENIMANLMGQQVISGLTKNSHIIDYLKGIDSTFNVDAFSKIQNTHDLLEFIKNNPNTKDTIINLWNTITQGKTVPGLDMGDALPTFGGGKAVLLDENGLYTPLLGLHMQWMDWIYVQLGLFGLTAIFTYLSNMVAGIMGKNIEISLRNRALERLVKLDMSYYSDKKIGEILTRIVSDTQIIGDQAQQVPVTMLSAILTFFGSLAMMFTINSYLSVVVVIAMVIILVALFGTFGVVRKLMFRVRDSITSINGDVTDRIATVRLIKASGTEEYETERFKDIHKDYFKKSKSLIGLQSLIITVLIVGISSIQIVIVIAAALKYNDNPQLLAVTLSSFISGVGTMIGPIMQTVRIVVGVIQASTSSQRIDTILKAESRINPHYGEGEGVYVDKISDDIIFKDVEFAYPEKPENVILPKFNFTFEQGKSYAFVGETGVGKSTISKLLLRFYDPSNGQILINGNTDLKDVHLSSYLDKVGYVEQEPQILFGNVFDNIRYGRFDATDEEVIEAAKKAELDDLVQTWPDGYKTILGERGFMLSGGQKQRLVIARMFLKDPQILILDEATSALDNIVEKEIQANLENLMVGRTTVSIAHRLSTIKNCDQIIVLAKGEGIAQKGTFNELKNKEGHFKKLYEAGLME